MISVLILTKNEEINLKACVESVSWSDDVHVLDSYSTDQTVEIAKSLGVNLWFRKFDNFSAQQNWALRNIPFKHTWVFQIDADEVVTPELAEAMLGVVKEPGESVAFQMQRRDFFLGTWLRHVQLSPFYIRLFRHEKMSYQRIVHQISVPDGPVGRVTGYLDHYPFSKGIADWMARHNSYSTMEAQQVLNNKRAGEHLSLRTAFFEKDFHERRRHQKMLFYRVPCRPLFKFLLLYVAKRGFLDGNAGFTYAVLQGIYEYLIILKTHELERAPVPRVPDAISVEKHVDVK